MPQPPYHLLPSEGTVTLKITPTGDIYGGAYGQEITLTLHVAKEDTRYHRHTFDEYAETEDWPYVNDDCTPKLEQPITRFFYTEAQTDGISIVAGGSKAATGSEATYNLAGQRVGKSYKGIVVKDGRKYVK